VRREPGRDPAEHAVGGGPDQRRPPGAGDRDDRPGRPPRQIARRQGGGSAHPFIMTPGTDEPVVLTADRGTTRGRSGSTLARVQGPLRGVPDTPDLLGRRRVVP